MQSLKNFPITTLLKWWASWVGHDLPDSFCSTLGDLRTKGGGVCLLTDDEALLIDHCIAQLHQRDKRLSGVLLRYYLADMPIRDIAVHLKVSVSHTEKLLRCAEHWVDAWIRATIYHAA